MGAIRTSANAKLRDFVTDGLPASGEHAPVKSELRTLFGEVEDAIDAAAEIATEGLVGGYTTLSALNADLAHPAGSLAKVGGNGANDGVYRKSGSSGSGSWALFEDPVIAAADAAEAAQTAAEAAAAEALASVDSLFPEVAAIFASRASIAKFVEGSGSVSPSAFQNRSFTSGTSYTIRALVRASGRTFFNIFSATNCVVSATFNLTTEAVAAVGADNTATIQKMGRDFYLCTVTRVATGTGTSNVQFRMGSAVSTFTYTGDSTSGMFIPMVSMVVTGTATELLGSRLITNAAFTKNGGAASTVILSDAPLGEALNATVEAIEDDEALKLVRSLDGYVMPTTRLGVTGDSIIQRNHAALFGTEFGATSGVGGVTMARCLWPYFEFDVWEDSTTSPYWKGMNTGISGDTAAQVLARLGPISNLCPDIQVVAVGVNSITAGTNAATIMGQLEDICEHFLQYGKRVILANIRPVAATYDSSTWGDGSAKMTTKTSLNGLIATYSATTPNVTLWDVEAAHTNGASPPRPKTGHMGDGLHLTRLGGLEEGRSLVAVLKKLIKPIAVVRPRGVNLVTNPTMVGGGGTASTGITGTVGADWSVVRNLGSASAVAAYDADGQQIFTITPGGSAAEQIQISRSFGGVPVTPGLWYKGFIRISLSAWTGWRGPYVEFASRMAGLSDLNNTDTMTVPEELDLFIETPVELVPGGTTTLAPVFRMRIDGAAAGTGVLTVKEWGVFQVADPRPLHNFAV